MFKRKVNGVKAVANMRKLEGKSGFKGWCHKTCQNAWKLPVKYNSAIDAWHHVPASAKHTDMTNVPVGAPIFFEIGKFGHVVLQSDKKGYVISTDAPKSDFVGEVPLEWFKKHWGVEPLGWASVYNDTKLQLEVLPK